MVKFWKDYCISSNPKNPKISKIQVCCSKLILFNDIQYEYEKKRWTLLGHGTYLDHNDPTINHCPFCGTKLSLLKS